MSQPTQPVWFIADATTGLAAALAEAVLASGQYAVLAARAPAQLQALVDRHPDRALALALDVTNAASVDTAVRTAERQFGRIDVLATSAAQRYPGAIEEGEEGAMRALFEENVFGPINLARRVLPGMRERGFGRVLFTSSVAGLTGGIIGPHYAASKAGLHGLTHHLAARVVREGVTVNAIAPALIADTRMLPGDPEQLAARVPVGRLGTPAEVADLALAILRNGYLTSKVIALDGGMYPT